MRLWGDGGVARRDIFPSAPTFLSDMPAPEIHSLTGLRALPALLIVFYHFYREQIPGSIPVLHDVVDSGFTAVGMFFVLSGFILTYVYAGHDLRDRTVRRAFWVSRFARVYPVYLLSLVIGFAAQLPKSAQSLATGMGWVRLALALSLLNAASHYGMFLLNWAAWSLSVEAVFYLLFPWLAPPLKRLNSAGLAAVGALAWLGGLVAPAVYTHFDPDHLGHSLRDGDEVLWSWYLKFSPVTHVGSFVIGIVAGCLFLRRREALARVGEGKLSFVVGASLLFSVGLLVSQLVPHAYLCTDVLAPLYAILILALASEGAAAPLATRVLASAPAVALGRASYATYILHVPVFYVFAHFIPGMWDEGALFWPYLGALLIVSGVVYRFVEEPARRWVRSALTERRDASRAGTSLGRRG